MVAVHGFVARRDDDADLLDPALLGFLRDDLKHGLGEPVTIDQRQHGFLHGVGCRILSGASTGRRDHCLGNLHRALILNEKTDSRRE